MISETVIARVNESVTPRCERCASSGETCSRCGNGRMHCECGIETAHEYFICDECAGTGLALTRRQAVDHLALAWRDLRREREATVNLRRIVDGREHEIEVLESEKQFIWIALVGTLVALMISVGYFIFISQKGS